MSRGGLIARNAAFLFGGQAVSWSLGLVFIVLVPRSVGASAWGEWSLAWAITSVAASFSSMGLTTLLIKEISRDQSRAHEFIGAAITAQAMLAVPFLLLILGFINTAGYSAHTRLIITLVTAASLVAFLAVPVSAGLQALEKMHYSSLGQIFTSGVLSLVAVLLVKFAAVGMVAISVAAVAAAVAAAGIQFYGLSRKVRVWPRVDWKLIRHLIVGGLPYWASGLFLTFYVWIDTVMLSLMTSTMEVGWYGAATKLISTLGVLPYIINMAVFPALSHGFRHDREGMRRLAQTSLRIVLSLGLPMVIGVVLLGPKIVLLLYGWSFAPAAPIVVVLCLTLLPIFTATLVNGQLIAADRQLAWTGVMAACCVVNPVLNFTLIALFERLYKNGALGASYALLITDGLVGIAAVALLPRDVMGKMRGILPQLGRAAVAAGIMGIAVYLVRDRFVLIPLATGVAAFTVAALVLKVFTPADLELMRRLTRMLGAKVGLRQFRTRPPVASAIEVALGEAAEDTVDEPAAVAGEKR